MLQGGLGARVAPGLPEAARLHRLGQARCALERAGNERGEQRRVAARALEPDAAAPDRLGETRRVALERGHEPCGERDRERGAPGAAGGRDEPVVVEQERVGGEGEPERGQPQGVERRLEELRRRHVERPEHRDRRPLPEDRPVRARPEERREHEDAETSRERAEEIDAAAVGGRTQADGEQHAAVSTASAQRRSVSSAAVPAAPSRSAAGPGLTESSTVRAGVGSPRQTKRTGSPAVSPSSSAVRLDTPPRTSSTFAPAGTGVPSGATFAGPSSAPSFARSLLGAAVVADDDRPRLPCVAVQERLGERTDDDARLSFPLPGRGSRARPRRRRGAGTRPRCGRPRSR